MSHEVPVPVWETRTLRHLHRTLQRLLPAAVRTALRLTPHVVDSQLSLDDWRALGTFYQSACWYLGYTVCSACSTPIDECRKAFSKWYPFDASETKALAEKSAVCKLMRVIRFAPSYDLMHTAF